MSELPRGWTATKLGEIAIPRGERVSPRSHEEKQFIGLEHVEAHSTRILGSIPASQVKSSASVFRAGDVLYGRLRPYLNKVAKPDFEGLASAEFIVFPDQEHLRSAFLKHRLNASDFVSFASRLNAGDRPRVDFDQIRPFDIALPPPAEQQRIAEKVDELLSDLDAGIAALERARTNLKRYRAAMLKAAVEGRLTEKWRHAHPDVEPAEKLLERILAKRRKKWEEAQLAKYAEKGQAPPMLPNGWGYCLLAALLPADRSGTRTGPFGTLLGKHEHKQSGVPVIGIENISSMRFLPGSKIHVSLEKAEQLGDYELLTGDVVISRSGTVGEVCVIPAGLGEARMSTNLMRVRLAEGSMRPLWFCALFAGRSTVSNQIHELCSGSTRDFLNTEILNSIVFPLPPLDEQDEILRQLELVWSELDRLEHELRRLSGVGERLRQAILKRAFEGKLVPQDPKDEPAGELLARIRKAREEGALREPVRRIGRKAGGRLALRQSIRQDS